MSDQDICYNNALSWLQGAPSPQYTFGIGMSIVRKVKGVLIRQDETSGQSIFTAYPVSNNTSPY
jgi:hypothetical protein